MTIPPQPPLFFFPKFLSIFHTQIKIPPPTTMNDPKTQFSHTSDHNFTHPFAQNHSRLSQTNGICTNTSSDQEFVQFRPNSHHEEFMESDDSGVCSPPLWKNSPSPSQPLLGSHHVYRNLSPDSRLRAITRGQRELMEMVKTMPESSYELSLKDLVEHRKIETQIPQLNSQNLQQRGVVKVKRQESKKNDKNLMRVESFESKGLFLKMVFPFSLQSKKKKKNFASNSSGKVSPKPEAAKGGGERDWWKKKFTGSSDSDSSRTSNNSGSSGSSGSSSGRSDGGGGRKKNGLLRGCWPFYQTRSSKCVE